MMTKHMDIVAAVREELACVAHGLKGVHSNRQWTMEILKRIGALGEKNDFLVLPKYEGEHRTVPEWLYDLIWYKEDSAGLKSVELVLESEWSRKEWDVRYDFQKLLVAKAAVKVLVADGYDEAAVRQWVDNIKSFEPRDNGSYYLFALFRYPDEFEFLVYDERGEIVEGA